MATPNQNLKDFYAELKVLLGKYKVALDIKAKIVAVDLSKQLKPNDKTSAEPVGLVKD
jgi:hypothetical protein